MSNETLSFLDTKWSFESGTIEDLDILFQHFQTKLQEKRSYITNTADSIIWLSGTNGYSHTTTVSNNSNPYNGYKYYVQYTPPLTNATQYYTRISGHGIDNNYTYSVSGGTGLGASTTIRSPDDVGTLNSSNDSTTTIRFNVTLTV